MRSAASFGAVAQSPGGRSCTTGGGPTKGAERLARAIRDVLGEAIDAGGSSLRDHRQADGSLGYFQHNFRVYGRTGQTCATPACAGIIMRQLKMAVRPFFARNAGTDPGSTRLANRAIGFDSMLKLFGGIPKKTVSEIEVSHEGVRFRITLKRVGSARRLTLRVRAATRDAVLTMPTRTGLRQAQEFAQNHAAWIAQRMARLPQQLPFRPGTKISLRGVEHVLCHRQDSQARRGPVWVEEQNGILSICAGGDLAHFERRIADFLRREARRDLKSAVRRHSAVVGRAPRALSLRDTSSRWGWSRQRAR